MTIALNNTYSFGKDRLTVLQDEFNNVMAEYGQLAIDDTVHCNSVLKGRVDKIMGVGK